MAFVIWEYIKVLWRVVQSVSVPMMDFLRPSNWPAENRFCYHDVLEYVPLCVRSRMIRAKQFVVALLDDLAGAVVPGTALARAELSACLSVSRNVEHSPAISALNLRQFIGTARACFWWIERRHVMPSTEAATEVYGSASFHITEPKWTFFLPLFGKRAAPLPSSVALHCAERSSHSLGVRSLRELRAASVANHRYILTSKTGINMAFQ
jgi:hypothetical protein